jgi:hypothetical protein
MSRSQLVPVGRGALIMTRAERALAKRAADAQAAAIASRADDALRRELTAGRMKDTASLTKGALEDAGEIGDVLAEEVQARPFFARELADIATTGLRGLKAELRDYIEGS